MAEGKFSEVEKVWRNFQYQMMWARAEWKNERKNSLEVSSNFSCACHIFFRHNIFPVRAKLDDYLLSRMRTILTRINKLIDDNLT